LQNLTVLYKIDRQNILRKDGMEDMNQLKPGWTILIPIKKSDQP
jgi:hypothetical protein